MQAMYAFTNVSATCPMWVIMVVAATQRRVRVADQFRKVGEDLGGLASCILVEVKQLRIVINERCGGPASQELRVPQHILQKQNVGFHPSDLKLIQCTLHFLDGMHIAVGPHYDLQRRKIL